MRVYYFTVTDTNNDTINYWYSNRRAATRSRKYFITNSTVSELYEVNIPLNRRDVVRALNVFTN